MAAYRHWEEAASCRVGFDTNQLAQSPRQTVPVLPSMTRPRQIVPMAVLPLAQSPVQIVPMMPVLQSMPRPLPWHEMMPRPVPQLAPRSSILPARVLLPHRWSRAPTQLVSALQAER